ncbi:RNA-directed DNA polymerase, eukaryota, nucleotide-binding alpha-beta plait domain protein, partial [Tanacetum coccineum]
MCQRFSLACNPRKTKESSTVHAIQDQARKRFVFHSGFRCGGIKELGTLFLFKFRFVFGLNPTSLVIVFVMGFHHQNSLQSKLDQTAKISKSVFITNFSEECTSKDLWKVCNDYGTVIDVFIPNKRSKSGKRFAFVRFIKVSNLDRLVENLNTIWMGRFHLSANRARFDRPVVSPAPKQIPGIMSRPKYVQPNAIPKEKVSSPPYLLKPSLVIDDSCLVSRDLDNCVMGEVRQVTSINNMQV